MTFGTWAALIPSFQQRFGLSDGQLSWVLFGLVLGALISMPLTGQLIARWGSRTIALPAALAFCATLTVLALAPNYATLIAAAAASVVRPGFRRPNIVIQWSRRFSKPFQSGVISRFMLIGTNTSTEVPRRSPSKPFSATPTIVMG